MNSLLDNHQVASHTKGFNSQLDRAGHDPSRKHHDFFPETAKKSGELYEEGHSSEPFRASTGSGAKTFSSLLNTPAAQAVIEMGIQEQVVQLLLEAHQLETGSQYTGAEELYQAANDILDNPEKLRELSCKISQLVNKVEDEKSNNKKVQDVKIELSLSKCSEHSSEMMPVCSEITEKGFAKSQLKQRVRTLAAENKKLKEKKKCRSCKTVDLTSSGVTFLPCGHFITCEECAEKHDNCPACNQTIMGTVRTFLA